MKLYTVTDFPVVGSVQTYRQSFIPALLLVVLFTGLAVFNGVLAVRAESSGVMWVSTGLLLLVGFVFLRKLKAALGPYNWVLKYDGSDLAFNIRSYLNPHFPLKDRVVAVLPASAFEWVRKVSERKTLPGPRGEKYLQTWTFLDLRLKDSEIADALDRVIREEILREPPKSKNSGRKHNHTPIRVVDDSTLRVVWRSRRDRIRPGIDTVIQNLGKVIPVEPEKRYALPDYRKMEADELEGFLFDLTHWGYRQQAARVIREVHGLGFGEARAYLHRLLERTPPSAGAALRDD